MDFVNCPDCGALAEITERSVLESTDGPVEHVRVSCLRWHWFLMPTELLARYSPVASPAPEGVAVRPSQPTG